MKVVLRLQLVNYFTRNWERVRSTLRSDLLTLVRDVNQRVDDVTLLPSTTVADLNGTSTVGTSDTYSRGDHQHALQAVAADAPWVPNELMYRMVTDGGSPQTFSWQIRSGGVTLTFPIGEA